ncbi:ferric-chelate reductase 1-like [Mya arenaria]|uniref:ferric-chelate reductase 1-like n=1 Tax=Mya arenaria TaxID=6604 RepID=UPI0022E2273A|nr:ferric-chelate reductase 1-like [Mya arenaria]
MKGMMLVTLLLFVVSGLHAFSSGPPPYVCDNMTPNHPGSGQTAANPYTLTFSKSTYGPNEEIQVTLSGSQNFKGFLIQPRKEGTTSTTTYGKITPDDNVNTANPCTDGKTALGHKNDADRSSASFRWTAPGSDVGNIVFLFTVVKSQTVYWVKQESATLTFDSSQPTQQPTAAPPTTPSTEPPLQDSINADPGCGTTLSCFPSSCTTNCDYLVMWREEGTSEVEFTLKRKIQADNYYIAIGFSNDLQMGDDSVSMCVTMDGVVNVQSSYNNKGIRQNLVLDIETYGVTMVSGNYTNGVLSCTFKRKKNSDLAVGFNGRKKRVATDDSTFFDLNSSYFLLVAHGAANKGTISRHSERPVISQSKIDFLSLYTGDSSSGTTDGPVGTVTRDKQCGSTLGCFHDCNGGKCSFLLTWKDEADDVVLSLTCARPLSGYCAIGLSSDDKMGDDSVIECVSIEDRVDVYISYNDNTPSNHRLDDQQYGLSNMTTKNEDGVLTCKFSRKKVYQAKKKRATGPGPDTFFDMNKDWTLLYAYGKASSGFLNKHDVRPLTSDQKADFQSFMEIGASANDLLYKVHGILMVLAWMLMASAGIFMARFYKEVWPEGMEWCNLKRWFVVHRICMVLVFLLTAASFIIIFVKVGGYAKIDGSNFEKSHPIIGIVVMALTFINPLMAMCRPKPGESKRVLFNVAHGSAGSIAHTLSIVNLFSGLWLAEESVTANTNIVLWVFVGWIIFIHTSSHIYDCVKRRDQKNITQKSYNKVDKSPDADKDDGDIPILRYDSKQGEAYEMKDPTAGESLNDTQQTQVDGVKLGLLLFHMIVLLALTIAVVVMIARGGQSEHDHDK